MGKSKWYVVFYGRRAGVSKTWEEAAEQVNGFPGALHKSFKTEQEAETHWSAFQNAPTQMEEPKESSKRKRSDAN